MSSSCKCRKTETFHKSRKDYRYTIFEVSVCVQIAKQLFISTLVSCFLSSSAVTIGFDLATYTISETDSTVSRPVSVSVQSGSLARNVVVTVQTVDGTATGGTLMYVHSLCRFVIHLYHFSLQLQMTTQLCPRT